MNLNMMFGFVDKLKEFKEKVSSKYEENGDNDDANQTPNLKVNKRFHQFIFRIV